MKHLFFTVPICLLWMNCPSAIAQETAKVQISVKISGKVPSFKDQRLVIMLAHDYPQQDDRGDMAVDNYVDAKFSHTMGKETDLVITLGEKKSLNRNVLYFITLAVFTPQSKLTHEGVWNGVDGPVYVLTNGSPSKVTLLVRPVP